MSSQARREQVALAIERGHSKRRACELMDIARSGLAYRSVRAERDQPTLTAMRRLAAQYPRYGYRRIRVFLRREGYAMSRHRANHVGAYDFMFDACANGQQIKCPTLIDEFTRKCLSLEWFRSRTEARVVIETWRRHYNYVRPHQSLKDLTPIVFKASYYSIDKGAVLQL